MIIDVRYNGGGFVDQLIFDRLRRILAGMGSATQLGEQHRSPVRSSTAPWRASPITTPRPTATSSATIFKYYKLGPLIGERTWGGVRGIRGKIPLMDGGYITRPEASRYDLNSKWVIENRGVQPDIVVENRPDQVVKGRTRNWKRPSRW